MNLVVVNEKNFNELINLFNDGFCFLTTYPELVSKEELKMFFLESGKAYLIEEESKVIGLVQYLDFDLGYAALKFKLKSYSDREKSKCFFKETLKLIKKDIKDLKRLEMHVYQFEKEDIEFFKSLGLEYETKYEDDILMNNKLCAMLNYSLIGKEIDNMIEL